MIGVVVPSYNEGQNIQTVLLSIRKMCPDAWIIVVDDSPSPETCEYVNDLKDPKIMAIHRNKKMGRGSAVLEGISQALTLGCSILIEIDADMSHPPSQITELIREMKSRDLGLVIASRYLNESQIINWPFLRTAFSACANWLARLVLGIPVADYTNGFRCYSEAAARDIVQNCGKLGTGFIALSEILVHLYFNGYSIHEVPTKFVNRVRGESSVTYREISSAFLGLARIYFLKRKLVLKKLSIKSDRSK